MTETDVCAHWHANFERGRTDRNLVTGTCPDCGLTATRQFAEGELTPTEIMDLEFYGDQPTQQEDQP